MGHLKRELLQDAGGQLVLDIPSVVHIMHIADTPGLGLPIACGKDGITRRSTINLKESREI